jgi:4'-phosphopantetheinyl transferase
VRDLTPAGLRHVAHLSYAPVFFDEAVSNLCKVVLSDSEIRQSEQKANAEYRAEFVQRRAFRRYCIATALGSEQPLSKPVFEKTSKGRPYLRDTPELWVSFSSCSLGMLGAWSSTCALGVDIEDHTREADALALARQFFTSTETAAVEVLGQAARRQAFYQFWCLKEAALKSIGEGLPFGLDTFEIELHPEPRLLNAPAYYGGADCFDIHGFQGESMTVALVTRDRKPVLRTRAV